MNEEKQNVTNVDEHQDEIQALRKELNEEKKKNQRLLNQLSPLQNVKNNPFEDQKHGKTFKSRLLYNIFLCKDTSNPLSNESIINCVNIILQVIDRANSLDNQGRVIQFRDGEKELGEVRILDYFTGAFIPNEISEDFEGFDAVRFKPQLVLPLGDFERDIMPTFNEYEEALHSLKGLFKKYNENYVSLSSLHSTLNVSQYMRDCSINIEGKFHIARRSSSGSYFIPYYCKELNTNLIWKAEYYNDHASKYVDAYFNIYVYNLLRGVRE